MSNRKRVQRTLTTTVEEIDRLNAWLDVLEVFMSNAPKGVDITPIESRILQVEAQIEYCVSREYDCIVSGALN